MGDLNHSQLIGEDCSLLDTPCLHPPHPYFEHVLWINVRDPLYFWGMGFLISMQKDPFFSLG